MLNYLLKKLNIPTSQELQQYLTAVQGYQTTLLELQQQQAIIRAAINDLAKTTGSIRSTPPRTGRTRL